MLMNVRHEITPRGAILLVIPSVVLVEDGKFRVEADFYNNLRVYLRNFDRVVFACPALTSQNNQGYIIRSVPLEELPQRARYVPLPYTYREDTHLRNYLPTRRLLRSLIAEADYLLFSPHAVFDWPTVAAREAIRANRRFDIECDLDWNNLMRFKAGSMPRGLKRLRVELHARWLSHEVDRCLRKSAVALLQGKEVYEAYRHTAPNPRMVLNVQVDHADHIPDGALAAKVSRIRAGAPLRVIYAGQMTNRKGALDWVKAIGASGANVSATWFGDGPEMEAMRLACSQLGIELPGIRPRNEIMAAMRAADIFLFCHKVAESPRCLSEALASGAALVGYASLFPRGLVAEKGGGEFVPLGDWAGLGSLLAELDHDRERLANLVDAAAASGRTLDRDAAMQERIDLIKEHLDHPTALAG